MTDPLDALILSFAATQWKKVAMIISQTVEAGAQDPANAAAIGTRIERLVNEGRLEAAGDVRLWRASEVRLPHRRPDSA
jgi:hypothetical protein